MKQTLIKSAFMPAAGGQPGGAGMGGGMSGGMHGGMMHHGAGFRPLHGVTPSPVTSLNTQVTGADTDSITAAARQAHQANGAAGIGPAVPPGPAGMKAALFSGGAQAMWNRYAAGSGSATATVDAAANASADAPQPGCKQAAVTNAGAMTGKKKQSCDLVLLQVKLAMAKLAGGLPQGMPPAPPASPTDLSAAAPPPGAPAGPGGGGDPSAGGPASLPQPGDPSGGGGMPPGGDPGQQGPPPTDPMSEATQPAIDPMTGQPVPGTMPVQPSPPPQMPADPAMMQAMGGLMQDKQDATMGPGYGTIVSASDRSGSGGTLESTYWNGVAKIAALFDAGTPAMNVQPRDDDYHRGPETMLGLGRYAHKKSDPEEDKKFMRVLGKTAGAGNAVSEAAEEDIDPFVSGFWRRLPFLTALTGIGAGSDIAATRISDMNRMSTDTTNAAKTPYRLPDPDPDPDLGPAYLQTARPPATTRSSPAAPVHPAPVVPMMPAATAATPVASPVVGSPQYATSGLLSQLGGYAASHPYQTAGAAAAGAAGLGAAGFAYLHNRTAPKKKSNPWDAYYKSSSAAGDSRTESLLDRMYARRGEKRPDKVKKAGAGNYISQFLENPETEEGLGKLVNRPSWAQWLATDVGIPVGAGFGTNEYLKHEDPGMDANTRRGIALGTGLLSNPRELAGIGGRALAGSRQPGKTLGSELVREGMPALKKKLLGVGAFTGPGIIEDVGGMIHGASETAKNLQEGSKFAPSIGANLNAGSGALTDTTKAYGSLAQQSTGSVNSVGALAAKATGAMGEVKPMAAHAMDGLKKYGPAAGIAAGVGIPATYLLGKYLQGRGSEPEKKRTTSAGSGGGAGGIRRPSSQKVTLKQPGDYHIRLAGGEPEAA